MAKLPKADRSAKLQFQASANSKMRHVPEPDRSKCDRIDAKAAKLQQKWQKKLSKTQETRVAREFMRRKIGAGNSPSNTPPGMDKDAQHRTQARAAVQKKQDKRLQRFDNVRKDMRNKIGEKHGVTLHPDRGLSKRFGQAAGISRSR